MVCSNVYLLTSNHSQQNRLCTTNGKPPSQKPQLFQSHKYVPNTTCIKVSTLSTSSSNETPQIKRKPKSLNRKVEIKITFSRILIRMLCLSVAARKLADDAEQLPPVGSVGQPGVLHLWPTELTAFQTRNIIHPPSTLYAP